MMRAALASAAIAAVAGLSTPAEATTAVAEETYNFTGACIDCFNGDGDIHATLVLENYKQGASIEVGNFVSLSYSGSDLLPAFTVLPADLTVLGIVGAIPTILPGPAKFWVFFDLPQSNFITNTDGTWYVNASDYGTSGTWSATPEPATWSMMLIGFAGLAHAAARRAKTMRAARSAG
jgi:PEP-CTERM motif